MMKCPVCSVAELVHDTRDISYPFKGETTLIPDVTGDFCPACDEVVLRKEDGDRYSELIGLFQRKVNIKPLSSSFPQQRESTHD